jgi:hypothetical protein
MDVSRPYRALLPGKSTGEGGAADERAPDRQADKIKGGALAGVW